LIIFVTLSIKPIPMKLRLPFTFRIILPYLVIAIFFLLIFLAELEKGHSPAIWLSAGGMLATLILAALHNRWISQPFRRTGNLSAQLARGSIPRIQDNGSRGETGDPKGETGDLEKNLETHIRRMREITSFAKSLASGDFTAELEKTDSEDALGESMRSLKRSLMGTLEESRVRSREEEHRTWSAQGLARFSTLFREAEDDLEDLSRILVKELVEYTEADVGALFIATELEGEGEPVLEMTGSYAFDREKNIRRSFELGEGLVGRVALEKEPIYITDLPPGYIRIRSGLGEEAPTSVLLVPLLLDNRVMGVIELASLGEIPAYQIEFIRRLGDDLATSLARVKAGQQMKKLFEQTNMQAEKFASQEKVFRKRLQQLEKEVTEYAAREAKLIKEIDTLRNGEGEE